MAEKEDAAGQHKDCDHAGIFTIPGPHPILSMWRDLTYQPLADGLWTVSEGIYRTIFIRGKTGVIAFDTFSTPGGARAYQMAIGRVYPGKEIHTVIYSHDHLDHTGYAADLAPKADILAHDLCGKVIAARKSDGQLPATEVWSGERKQFEIDGVRFELLYPGPTHGDGNVAAHFPDHKLLFMVDTVIPGVGYTFFPDWHIRPYVDNMRRLLSLEWDTFVPGHFWTLGRKDFEDNLQYYLDVSDVAQDAIGDGVAVDDLEATTKYAQEKLRDRYGHLFRFDEYIGMNLMRYMHHFLSGGWGIEGNMKPESGNF